MAFYRLPDGKIIESVVSFWNGILRKRYGVPVFVHDPAAVWDRIAEMNENNDIRAIAESLPPRNSEFLMSLQRNEMLVLGMSDDEWNDAISAHDIAAINKHLYRVWKLGSKDYNFKFHTDTTAQIKEGDKEMKMFHRIGSIQALLALNPRKVSVSILGEIDLENLTQS